MANVMIRSCGKRLCFAASAHRLQLPRFVSSKDDYADPAVAKDFASLVNGLDEAPGSLISSFEARTIGSGLQHLGLGAEGVRGRRVLDAGCGEGRLSRKLFGAGASVVGVDSSVAMVAAARAGGGGPQYAVADIADEGVNLASRFDLSLCVYVLQMAQSADQLQAMVNCLRRHSERTLILTVNGEYEPNSRQSDLMQAICGFQSVRAGHEGQLHFVFGDNTRPVTNYQWSEEQYLECLARAGFQESGVVAFRVSQQYKSHVERNGSDDEKELLKLYSANPHVKGFFGSTGATP